MTETTDYPDVDPTLSRDAQHATYEPAEEGIGSVQTQGKPAEAAAPKTTTRRSSSSASSTTSES